MGGLVLLLALSVVMVLASFLAGALPLSMTLSQQQLRLISSIGIGILVGTSLIVIIPEGIEAVATAGVSTHSHSSTRHASRSLALQMRWVANDAPLISTDDGIAQPWDTGAALVGPPPADLSERDEPHGEEPGKEEAVETPGTATPEGGDAHDEISLPTPYIGFSLMLGFVMMFLIDRLPRHAADKFQTAPATRHISLDNLASSGTAGDEDSESFFLGSLAPTPKQSRSLATTTGLVIHAAADGIAMGASATTSDMKLGFIIFIAIMIHKAPAAFGLTSILLKQGLSKRAARGHLVIFSLAAPVGALTTYLAVSLLGRGGMEGEGGRWWTGMLLLFSAGTFLYVAMHAMQEDHGTQGHEHHAGANGYADGSTTSQRKQSKPQMRDTFATVAGMLLPLLTQFGHHH